MSNDILDQDGVTITTFTGPMRADGGVRLRWQISTLSPEGERTHVVLTFEQWDIIRNALMFGIDDRGKTMVSEAQHLANAKRAHDLRVCAEQINAASTVVASLRKAGVLNTYDGTVLDQGIRIGITFVNEALNNLIGVET